MEGSVEWSSRGGEVGSEGANATEDSVDSLCGFEGASEVTRKFSK